MSNAGVHDKIDRLSRAESFENWFDRELAEINAGLARLESSLEPRRQDAAKPRPQRSKRIKQQTSQPPAAVASSEAPPPAAEPVVAQRPVGDTAAAPAPPSVKIAPVPAQPPPTAPTPPHPTGTDLADPKNFGMMPPTADLERGTASPEEYRTRLARHLAFATKVLHTSRVPAAVWREWRAFEKSVHERLRELATRPPEPVEQY